MDKLDLIQFQNIEVLNNKKGDLYKILSKKKELKNIEEIYCSKIKPSQIKAWRLHTKITNKLIILKGKVALVACKNNKFHKILLNKKKVGFCIIKPNIWYGFKCVGKEEAVILNFINKKYKENEIKRIDKSKIRCKW